VLSVVVVLALPGDWVYVGWLCGLLVLFVVARVYLRAHPQTPPSYRAPWWLTSGAFMGGLWLPLLVLGIAAPGDWFRWMILALGFAQLANVAAERWWDSRTAAPISKT
jgi:hypothetical protein